MRSLQPLQCGNHGGRTAFASTVRVRVHEYAVCACTCACAGVWVCTSLHAGTASSRTSSVSACDGCTLPPRSAAASSAFVFKTASPSIERDVSAVLKHELHERCIPDIFQVGDDFCERDVHPSGANACRQAPLTSALQPGWRQGVQAFTRTTGF